MTESELKERLTTILDEHEAYTKDLFRELYDMIISEFDVEEDEESEEYDDET